MPLPGVLLKHVVTAARMIVHARLRTQSERRTAGVREPVALPAPAPAVLAARCWVVLRKRVLAAGDVNVSVVDRAAHFVIEAENLTFPTSASLILSQDCVVVNRQFVVIAFVVIVLVFSRARSRRASGESEAIALVAPSPVALIEEEVTVVKRR